MRAIAVLLSAALSLNAAAAPFGGVRSPTPSSISVGDQYYDMGVTGLREFMRELEPLDKQAHITLLPDLERLETKRLTAVWVTGALGLAGASLFVLGVAGSAASTNTVLLFSGVGLAVAAAGMYYFLSPSREDFMGFINKHNRLRPKAPLKLQFGLMPQSGGATGIIAYQF